MFTNDLMETNLRLDFSGADTFVIIESIIDLLKNNNYVQVTMRKGYNFLRKKQLLCNSLKYILVVRNSYTLLLNTVRFRSWRR